MRGFLLALIAVVLVGCAGPGARDTAGRRDPGTLLLPAMKTFGGSSQPSVTRSNTSIARDIMELVFELESGRKLPVLSRFEGPVTVRVVGAAPPSLGPDLARLMARLRAEAGIPIARVEATQPAGITIEVVRRRTLQRAVPQAACFVAPRVSSWNEFVKTRRQPLGDWTTLQTRQTMAIFLPGDVSPQEIRDCLHEELAQALGPVNDLYRLPDSVFHDDNFNAVLTPFDMIVLRAVYAPELQSGMAPASVAAALPGILNRINPAGRNGADNVAGRSPAAWKAAVNAALVPQTGEARRLSAAKQAVAIAQAEGWSDTRMGFSLFVLGRAALGVDGPLALTAFLRAGEVYSARAETRIHAAHVAVQMAAFSLSAGQPQAAVDLVNAHVGAAMIGENAGLLATLLMIKAEALDLLGRPEEARITRLDSLGWARYGFGSDQEVRSRLAEIAALSPVRPRKLPT